MRNVYATIDQSGLEPGDHLCFLYDREEDYRSWAIVSLHQALVHGEKIVFVLDSDETEAAFQRSWGILPETRAAIQRDRLRILDLRGQLDWSELCQHPEVFLRHFHGEAAATRRGGYRLLRLVANLTSVTKEIATSDQMIQFEINVDKMIRQQPFALVCEYDRRQVSYDFQLNLIAHHPLLAQCDSVFENFYYIPYEASYSSNSPEVVLQHWLNNLATYRQAQQELWEASMRDSLTGFYNQAFFESELATMEQIAPRAFSLVMVLVDHPEINLEGFDPRIAHEYLRRAAGVLKAASRETDVIARLDDRQFAVLVPGGDSGTMEETVQRIRTALSDHNREHQRVPLNLFLWGASSRTKSMQ
ncbi:MAG TPA: MEDS domain-containing protein [Anaerolineaceae bacterium]|nr:MEDS domain-containing protein [Anaerolineaceae bacterium]